MASKRQELEAELAELERKIELQVYPSIIDLAEIYQLKEILNEKREGVEIVIDAWLIDVQSREYADISVFFYAGVPVTVGDVHGWFNAVGYRLQRKSEGLDRVQISGWTRDVPPGEDIHIDWQAYLDQTLGGAQFTMPSTTGHHRRLTPEEQAMRRLQRNEAHRTTQERLDREFIE